MLTLVSEDEIIAAEADVTSDRSRLTYRGFRTEVAGGGIMDAVSLGWRTDALFLL